MDRDGQAQPDPIKGRKELAAEALLGLDTGGLLNEARAAQSTKETGLW